MDEKHTTLNFGYISICLSALVAIGGLYMAERITSLSHVIAGVIVIGAVISIFVASTAKQDARASKRMLQRLILSATPNEITMEEIRRVIRALGAEQGLPYMSIEIREGTYEKDHVFRLTDKEEGASARIVLMQQRDLANLAFLEPDELMPAFRKKYTVEKSHSLTTAWEVLLKEIIAAASGAFRNAGLPSKGAACYANTNTMTLGAAPIIDGAPDERFKLILEESELQSLIRQPRWERTAAVERRFAAYLQTVLNQRESTNSNAAAVPARVR